MDRRFFLTTAIGAMVGTAAKNWAGEPQAATKTIAEKLHMGFDYAPSETGWSFHLKQELDLVVDRGELDALVNGGVPLYHTDFGSRPFPSPPRLEEIKAIRQKPGGDLFATEVDPDAPPRYYHVRPARFTASLNGTPVAASPEGEHFSDDIAFGMFFATSRDHYTPEADPLIATVAKYLSAEGYAVLCTHLFNTGVLAGSPHPYKPCWITDRVQYLAVKDFGHPKRSLDVVR